WGRRAADFALPLMEARSAAVLRERSADPRLALVPFSRFRMGALLLRAGWRAKIPFRFIRAIAFPESSPARIQSAAAQAIRRGEIPSGAGPADKIAAVERMIRDGSPDLLLGILPTFASGLLCLVLVRRLIGSLATEPELQAVLRALPHNPTTE